MKHAGSAICWWAPRGHKHYRWSDIRKWPCTLHVRGHCLITCTITPPEWYICMFFFPFFRASFVSFYLNGATCFVRPAGQRSHSHTTLAMGPPNLIFMHSLNRFIVRRGLVVVNGHCLRWSITKHIPPPISPLRESSPLSSYSTPHPPSPSVCFWPSRLSFSPLQKSLSSPEKNPFLFLLITSLVLSHLRFLFGHFPFILFLSKCWSFPDFRKLPRSCV